MSDSKKTNTQALIGAGALVLVGAIGVGFLFRGGDAKPAAATAVTQGAPKPSDDWRYMVPVTLSQPKLGSGEALVTVVEWCDLRGAPCREAEATLSALRRQYGERLRVVHRHLPDLSHSDSGLIHNFAHGAFDQAGKFWEVRERLLVTPDDQVLTEDDLHALASEVGIAWEPLKRGLDAGSFSRKVGVDIIFAKKFGVTSGPTFFVNGRRLPSVPADQQKVALSRLIDEELTHAEAYLQRGVAKDKLYDEIIKEALWSIDDDPETRKAANAERAAKDKLAAGEKKGL